MNMIKEYRYTATTVSMINYHIVFCPRYRRKIFTIPGVEERFKQLTRQTCDENGIDILAMECHIDHVHLFVSALPQMPIPKMMKVIKGASSRKLREEFAELSGMRTLWTRSYFISTAGKVSPDTIEWYVKTQKTRG